MDKEDQGITTLTWATALYFGSIYFGIFITIMGLPDSTTPQGEVDLQQSKEWIKNNAGLVMLLFHAAISSLIIFLFVLFLGWIGLWSNQLSEKK